MKRIAPLAASVTTSGLSVATTGMIAMAVSWSIIAADVGVTWAGVASFCIQLPVVPGLFVGGLLADRCGARRVLVASNTAVLLALCGAAGLALSGVGGWVAAVAASSLANLLGAPGTVAQDSRVPELARIAGLPLERANGLRDVAFNLGLAAGPAIAVLLVGFGGLPAALLAAAGLNLVVGLLDWWFFPAFRARAQADRGNSMAGLRYARRDPVLLAISVLGIGMVAVFASLDEIVVPSLAVASGLGSTTLAAFLALSGGAALGGGLAYAVAGHRAPPRGVLLGGLACAAAGLLCLAALPPAWAMVVAPVLVGLGVGPLQPLVNTALQRRVPAALRGSVLGAFGASILVMQPFAALGVGPLTAVVGANLVAWCLALMAVAATGLASLLPALRMMDKGGQDA